MRALVLGLVAAVKKATLSGPAKCLDGSPGIYYADMTSSSNEWIIYLVGGGMCGSEASCAQRKRTRLGTSTLWASDLDFSTAVPDVVSRNATKNPHFHGFNRVFVPYCSGDLWTGRQTASQANGLLFAGAHIVDAVRKALPIDVGSAGASRILLTGDSAGGIGAIYHADSFYDVFVGQGVTVQAAPRGGFIFPQVLYSGADAVNATEPSTRLPQNLDWWNGTWVVSQQCTADHGSEYCAYPSSLVKYMKTPVFVIEALTDNVVTSAPFGSLPASESAGKTAFLNAWAANMTAAIHANLKPNDGAFAPACFMHIEFAHEVPRIDGKGYDDVLAAWYKGLAPPPSLDACEPKYPPCNPSCRWTPTSTLDRASERTSVETKILADAERSATASSAEKSSAHNIDKLAAPGCPPAAVQQMQNHGAAWAKQHFCGTPCGRYAYEMPPTGCPGDSFSEDLVFV
jgi:hypothetical protein